MSTRTELIADERALFIDPTARTQWVQRLMIAHLALALVACIVGALEYRLLLDYQNLRFESLELAQAAGRASDLRQTVIGGLQWVVVLLSACAMLQWVQRVNDNLHRLGATGLRFSPRKAQLSFLVPLLNLWMPYLAVREIAKCSSSPLAWRAEPVSPLVLWWWGLSLSYVGVTAASVYLSLYSDGIYGLQIGSALSLLSDVLNVAVVAALYYLLAHICRLQLQQSDFVMID